MKKFIAHTLLFLMALSIYATDPLRVPTEDPEKMAMDLRPESDERVTIDYMVVYTTAAKEWAATRGGISNLINQGMLLSQTALDNSNVYIDLNLLHTMEVDYVQTGNSLTDLRRFTFGYSGAETQPDPLYFHEARTARDSLGVDLMVLVCSTGDAAGLGWQLSTEAGRPVYGTNLVMVHYINQLTKIHEIGHNMGAHHAKDQTVSPGPGLYSFSAGWRFYGSDNKLYSSLMSYTNSAHFPSGGSSTRVPYWSNPDVNYRDTPTGNALDGDNAKTVNMTRFTVANYRTRPDDPEPPPPPTIYFPVVNTRPITNIGYYSAVSGVEVVDSGNAVITDKGIYIDVYEPTEESRKVPNDPALIVGLNHDTEYFVKGYAVNSAGIGWGQRVSFKTLLYPRVQTISSPPFVITVNSNGKWLRIDSARWFLYQISNNNTNQIIRRRINLTKRVTISLPPGTYKIQLGENWLSRVIHQTHIVTIY